MFKKIYFKNKNTINKFFSLVSRIIYGNVSYLFTKSLIKESKILVFNKIPINVDLLDINQYKTNGIIIEIGSGNGEHLAHLCKMNTTYTVLGIEKTLKYVKKTSYNLQRKLCLNGKIIHGDALDIFNFYIHNKSIDKIYIICPDPWPKKHHEKRRITYYKNLSLLMSKLKDDGEIYFITDDPILAQTTDSSIEKLKLKFYKEEFKKIPNSVFKTKYIKKWESQNKTFWKYTIK